MILDFEIGDKVRIDGVDGIHVIKEIKPYSCPIGWHAIAVMEDGKVGLIDSSGYTDLEKI